MKLTAINFSTTIVLMEPVTYRRTVIIPKYEPTPTPREKEERS